MELGLVDQTGLLEGMRSRSGPRILLNVRGSLWSNISVLTAIQDPSYASNEVSPPQTGVTRLQTAGC